MLEHGSSRLPTPQTLTSCSLRSPAGREGYPRLSICSTMFRPSAVPPATSSRNLWKSSFSSRSAICRGKRRIRVVGRGQRRMVVGRFARHHRVDHRREPLGLRRLLRGIALGELRQHLAAEQLERLHDVLVAVLAGLITEDHLVDAALLVAPQKRRGTGRACRSSRAGRRNRRRRPSRRARPGSRAASSTATGS